MKKLMTIAAAALAILVAGCGKNESNGMIHRNGIAIQRIAEPQDVALGGMKGFGMTLSPVGNFAPNVNCLQQNAPGMDISQFMETSMAQYKALNANVLARRIVSSDEATVDVTFSSFGHNIRCHQRILKNGSVFHVVTACAAESTWSEVSGRLMACVNSARVE